MNGEIRDLMYKWKLHPGSTTALGLQSFATIDEMADYLDIVLSGSFDENIAWNLRDYRTIDNRIAREGQLGYILSLPWSFHDSLGPDSPYTLDQCKVGIAAFLNVTVTYTTSWSETLLVEPVSTFIAHDTEDLRDIHKAHPSTHLRKWKHIRQTLDLGVPASYLCDIEFEYEVLTAKRRGIAGYTPEHISELHRLGVPAAYANELNICAMGSVYRRPERVHELHVLGMPASYIMDANDACLQGASFIEKLDYDTIVQAWKNRIPIEYLLA